MARFGYNEVSSGHALAFWTGAALTAAGVALQLPMYFMARGMHYRLAGMPVTAEMLIGMGMIFLGLAVTAYSLFPQARTRAGRTELSAISIRPLDDARIGRSHITLLLVMSIAVTIDGMKPAAFAFVVPGTEAEYGLRGPLHPTAHSLPIGLYPLSGITGTVLGSLIWGWAGDRIGRRASILFAAILFIASSTCGAMPRYWMNLLCCFIMGLAAGGMLPVGFTLLSETVPRRHRGWMMILIGSNILTALVLDSWLASTWASPAHFGWRLLWLIGLPTGMLLVGLNHWIPESPRFLLGQGREDEARDVMRRYGAVLEAEPRPTAKQDLGSLLGRPFLSLTAAIVFLAFSVGFVQYGFQQWMPSNLERLGFSSVYASSLLRDAAIIGLPFSVPIAVLYHAWGSKKTALCVASLIAAALAAFMVLGTQATANRTLLLALLVLPLGGTNMLNAVLAAYTTEVYPTAVRARGSGVSAGSTKVGGVLILALITVAFAAPSIRMTAAFGAIPMAGAAIALTAFGPETRHKPLEQITAEELRPRNASLPASAGET